MPLVKYRLPKGTKIQRLVQIYEMNAVGYEYWEGFTTTRDAFFLPHELKRCSNGDLLIDIPDTQYRRIKISSKQLEVLWRDNK
jgi:hypothetical protein